MATAKEHLEKLNSVGIYRIKSMNVKVKIVDIREAYGRVDYRIEPDSGNGGMWVSSESVNLVV